MSADAHIPESPDAGNDLTPWTKISTAYLFLPLILFIATQLSWWIALPLLGCIAASIAVSFRPSGIPAHSSEKTKPGFPGIAAIAIIFAILTGLVDWVPQSTDYPKHNLILGDLIERPWPVRYETDDGSRYLCYGLGHYLIPAGFAKIFGLSSHVIAGFVWSVLELFLFFLWLGRQFAKHPKVGIAVTLLCAGPGLCWHIIKSGFLVSLFAGSEAGLAVSARLLDLGLFTSNLDSFARIFYQPQHGIVAWLGGALLYETVIARKRWPEAAAILAATFFWSPLTAIGLGVIGLAALFTRHRSFTLRPGIHILTAFLVIVALAMARGILENPSPKPAYIYLVAVFLVGAAFPLYRPFDNLLSDRNSDYRISTLRDENLNSILDLTMPGFDPKPQYLGDSDAPLAKWLLKSAHTEKTHGLQSDLFQ